MKTYLGKLSYPLGSPFTDVNMVSRLGQYYCTPCARHFIDATTRDLHVRTKVHKRRCVSSNAVLCCSQTQLCN